MRKQIVTGQLLQPNYMIVEVQENKFFLFPTIIVHYKLDTYFQETLCFDYIHLIP